MKILGYLLILIGTASIAYNRGFSAARHKNFEADRYAAEWGCLSGGRRGCEMLADEKNMYACFDFMVQTFCPKEAEYFEKFLKQS